MHRNSVLFFCLKYSPIPETVLGVPLINGIDNQRTVFSALEQSM